MPTEKHIEITYEYLKQGKWKFKTEIIKEDELHLYEIKFKIINKKQIYC